MNRSHKTLVIVTVIIGVAVVILVLKLVEMMLMEAVAGNVANTLLTMPILGTGLFALWYIVGSAHYEATLCPYRNS